MMPVGETMMPVGEKMMTVGENPVRASRLWLAAPFFFFKNTIKSFQDIGIIIKVSLRTHGPSMPSFFINFFPYR
jgi:hypothetical protein